MTLSITVALLTAGAVYLFTKREMLRIILGFVLIGHAGNLILFAAGGTDRRTEAFHPSDDPSAMVDPLPQAFVLTAIVIAFAIKIGRDTSELQSRGHLVCRLLLEKKKTRTKSRRTYTD